MSVNPPSPRARCTVVDLLEGRRLFAGFDANFSFQVKGAPPSDYVADYGKAYVKQGAFTYGWNVDNSKRIFDRKTAAKQRYDNVALLGDSQSASRWEVAVPNGLYDVKVMSGDATKTNSRYAISVEGTTVLDRTPNKASPWRKGEKLVWVSDGKLTLTSAAGAVNNKINNIDIRQADPFVTGQDIINPFAMQGLVQNEVPTKRATKAMKDLGTKTVRLWYDPHSWDNTPDDSFFNFFAQNKAAGFHTMVIFSTPSVPTSADEVKAFYQRIIAHKGVKDLIDIWEIGNEPNVPAYWSGTLPEFVSLVMKPAYEVLHAAGEPVIGGGVSYNVDACVQLEAAGYSDYCDYAGFHPYGETGDIVVQRARDAKAAFGNMPMIVTEWNVQGLRYDVPNWANQLQIAAAGLSQIAYLNYYYTLQTDTSHVGTGGAINPDGTPNEPFYSIVKSWSDHA